MKPTMAVTNLPTDLLRTFITAIDLGGYTRAAEVLGRSQPAVSLQMQRLETLLGNKLIIQSGREMKLTEDGKALAVIARQMLRLNDMAVGQFERARVHDAVRIGLPIDFAVTELQRGLTSYTRRTADAVRMEIHCDLSRILLERLHRDEIDMAIALFPGGDQQYLVQQWQEQPALGGEPECQHCARRTGAAGHAPGRLRIPQPHDRCTDGAAARLAHRLFKPRHRRRAAGGARRARRVGADLPYLATRHDCAGASHKVFRNWNRCTSACFTSTRGSQTPVMLPPAA
jgi:DNA-binding transcriptional LysR family regulator